ncbi:hypothetical protein SAMN05216327_12239 [Dyadobacter sp. SG02]|nr:hypothetical protein SAMN05216327_12239 [Dyadobacter sp. SG02]
MMFKNLSSIRLLCVAFDLKFKINAYQSIFITKLKHTLIPFITASLGSLVILSFAGWWLFMGNFVLITQQIRR